MKEMREILVECAKIYNNTFREALKNKEYYYEIDENKVEEEAYERIREFLETQEIDECEYEFITVYCNCSEIPFPRDPDKVGLGGMAGRGCDCPGLKIRDKKVCLCCGR